MIQVSALCIYPIKSCAGISVSEMALDRFGPLGDRRWMLLDASGQQITQREQPQMALITARPSAVGLELGYKGAELTVARPEAGPQRAAAVWQDSVVARDAGDEAAAWFSDILGCESRLVWMPDDAQRKVDQDFASHGETVSFADGFPLLLTSEASLADLNSRLSRSVLMNRFRPNIVVSGCDAFAEDSWAEVSIAGTGFELAKPCARCVMPSVNQETAEQDSEILRVLASYRRAADRNTYFGQNLLYQTLGAIRVGDELKIVHK